ncbi:oxidoreductase, partial [Pseudomonas sp. HMWF005]
MKRFKLQRPLPLCISTTLFAFASNVMAGSCVAVNSKTETLNFGASLASSTLTIPADTPNGTVVYQDTVRSTGHIWSCSKTSMFGIQMNPKLGTATGTESIFPLGKSGLSYRVWFEALSRYETALQAIAANTSYGFGANSVRLEIIKTGELTSKVNIDAGYLGSLQDDDLILKKLNLMNPIVLNTASCQTPSVPVAMGDDYQLDDFREASATSRKVRFDIALN